MRELVVTKELPLGESSRPTLAAYRGSESGVFANGSNQADGNPPDMSAESFDRKAPEEEVRCAVR